MANHGDLVWRIEINHNTTMWNEGFEHARQPWAVIYTDSERLAGTINSVIELQWNPGAAMDHVFSAKVYQTPLPALTDIGPNPDFDDETYYNAIDDPDNFNRGFYADPQAGLDAIVERLRTWEGI
jgi:hypothetical protein